MLKISKFFSFLIFQIIFNLSSVNSEVLSLHDVLQSVKDNHPVLIQDILSVSGADASVLSAQGAYDPRIESKNFSYLNGFYSGSSSEVRTVVPISPAFGSVYAGFRKGSGTLPVYEDEYQTLQQGEFGVGTSFSLFRDFLIDKRKLALSLANYDKELADLGLISTQIALEQAASQSYWSWIVQSHITRVYQKLLGVAEKRQVQLNKRVESGDLAAFEALDNQRTILQRKARVVKQEAITQEFANALSLFLRDLKGKPVVPNELQVTDDLPSSKSILQDRATLVAEAVERRPDLKRIDVELSKLDTQLQYEESRLLPDVTLETSLTRDRGEGSSSRDGTEVKGFLNVEIPIFQRSSRGKIALTNVKQKQQRLKLRYLQEQIETEIATLIAQIRQSDKRVEISQSEFETTKKLEEGEATRFRNGDSNLLFLAIRELAAAEAEVHVLQALAENFIYHAKLGATLGRIQITSD